MKKIYFTKAPEGIAQQSRAALRGLFDSLAPGQYSLVVEEAKRGYTPTRYRYYFGCILPQILHKCSERFLIQGRDGVLQPVQSTDDLHFAIKAMFNPVVIVTPAGAYTIGESTTNLNDRDFISEFLPNVMSHFADAPYFVEFQSFEDWRKNISKKYG